MATVSSESARGYALGFTSAIVFASLVRSLATGERVWGCGAAKEEEQ
eukprot:CAMPEP_0173313286 /NCGR_PEP_ID=MMETSP1143-20121109/24654_1 /TAXON_ID=483371 /ORGANISM="non described non described, Strain CCMP2298" /LENGTH=46 /DNA_ID= /DNA_START= /DNA_END= /DNA_ORIENTATION=